MGIDSMRRLMVICLAVLVALVAGARSMAGQPATTHETILVGSETRIGHYSIDPNDGLLIYCWQSPDGTRGACGLADGPRVTVPR